VEQLKEIMSESLKKIGSKRSRIQQVKKQSQLASLNNISLPETKEQAINECLESCPGPEKCRFAGELLYQPPNDIYGPYVFKCLKYAAWIKQLEIEKKIMDIIPKKFWGKSFENFQPISKDLSMALDICQKYVNKSAWSLGANMILLGGYGVGKTHLIAAILREAIKNGYTAVFVVASSLVLNDLEEIRRVFREIRDVDLVAIDDISAETNHKFVLSEIFELINYRYEAEKGMILTSNLQPTSFKNALGERIMDRLLERSMFIRIQDVDSFRKKRREKFLNWLNEER